MVMTQYGIKYAVHIITAHFGNLVAKVCETLLRKGPLTLSLLVRFTELSSSQVNNSLLILIQHNCVQAFTAVTEGEFGDATKADTQYLALFSNILHRMRFSKFLEIASEKFEKDKDCVELLEGLLQNGKLSMEQIIERAKSSKQAGNRPIPDVVHESLFKLLIAQFVERCPTPGPTLSPQVEEQLPRKRGAKAAKVSEVPATLEQRVIEASRPREVIRFSIGETNTEAEKSEHCSPISGQKRDDLEMVQESTDVDGVILWRANFDEFIRCLRHKACIEHVRSQFDDGVVNVLSAILKATRSSEKIVKTEITAPLSLDNIYEEVMKNEVGRSMTLDRVEASLSALGCSVMEDYEINLQKIIEQARMDEVSTSLSFIEGDTVVEDLRFEGMLPSISQVESVVLKKYGRDAYRMFRFLSKTGDLVETERISDTSFVDKNEAPKILYRLWKDEYLYMEKVAITVPKHTICLLWRVDRYNLWEQVQDEMYHASLSLQLRQAYEMEQDKELLNLPPDKRGGPLEKRYNRLRNVRLLLESSLLKLDDALMLFHDF